MVRQATAAPPIPCGRSRGCYKRPMLDRELEVAARLAREAGKIILSLYGGDIDVQYKGAADPVTAADERANEFLVKGLREAFPGDGIVAEETADRSEALQGGRVWYVDPLDGTKEFVARNGEFAVMLGLTVDADATLGVVYQPEFDKLYAGVVGHGAWLEQHGERKALRVSDVADPKQLQLVVSRSHRSESTDRFVHAVGIEKEIRSGSVGLKIGMIAERRADLYVHLSGKTSAWDSAGPEAIVRAAGGRFTDLGGEPFRYDTDDVLNRRGIFACNAAAFDAVLPTVKEIAADKGLI